MIVTVEVNIETVTDEDGNEVDNRTPFYTEAETDIVDAIRDALVALEVEHIDGEESQIYSLILDLDTVGTLAPTDEPSTSTHVRDALVEHGRRTMALDISTKLRAVARGEATV